MTQYRLHILDDAGLTERVIDLRFPTDASAMAEVRGRQFIAATELWRDGLKVVGFPADRSPIEQAPTDILFAG